MNDYEEQVPKLLTKEERRKREEARRKKDEEEILGIAVSTSRDPRPAQSTGNTPVPTSLRPLNSGPPSSLHPSSSSSSSSSSSAPSRVAGALSVPRPAPAPMRQSEAEKERERAALVKAQAEERVKAYFKAPAAAAPAPPPANNNAPFGSRQAVGGAAKASDMSAASSSSSSSSSASAGAAAAPPSAPAAPTITVGGHKHNLLFGGKMFDFSDSDDDLPPANAKFSKSSAAAPAAAAAPAPAAAAIPHASSSSSSPSSSSSASSSSSVPKPPVAEVKPRAPGDPLRPHRPSSGGASQAPTKPFPSPPSPPSSVPKPGPPAAGSKTKENNDDDLWDDGLDPAPAPPPPKEKKPRTTSSAPTADKAPSKAAGGGSASASARGDKGRDEPRGTKRGGGGDDDDDDDVPEPETDDDDDEHALWPELVGAKNNGPLERYTLAEGYEINPATNRYLHGYQRDGVQFLFDRVQEGKGAILGDEMGTGKTVQIASLLSAIMKKTGTAQDKRDLRDHAKRVEGKAAGDQEDANKFWDKGRSGIANNATNSSAAAVGSSNRGNFGPVLVVAPSGITGNWMAELRRWGTFSFEEYKGNNRAQTIERASNGQLEIVVVGKGLFVLAADFASIDSVDWKFIVVDEIHEFKGHSTQGYKCIEKIGPKHHRLRPIVGLTGTIMQNNHQELFYLCELVNPGGFGEYKDFRVTYEEPLKRSRKKDAKEDVVKRGDRVANQLQTVLATIYLRRLKQGINGVLNDDLTEKEENIIFTELTDIQRTLYQHVLSLPEFELLVKADDMCDCSVNNSHREKLRTMKKEAQMKYLKEVEYVKRKVRFDDGVCWLFVVCVVCTLFSCC